MFLVLEDLDLFEARQDSLGRHFLVLVRHLFADDLLLCRSVLCNVPIQYDAPKFGPYCFTVSEADVIGVHAVSSAKKRL